MSEITQKICLLGDFSVGKTSLIRRFVENKFSDEYLSTIGVKISRKSVDVKIETKEHRVNLLVWDLEGKTKFKAITPSYLKGASGAIVVGDLTRSDTIYHLNRHIKMLLEVNHQGVIMVALNKADLVPSEKLSKIVESCNFELHERVMATYVTSAKTGNFVSDLFTHLSTQLIAP